MSTKSAKPKSRLGRGLSSLISISDLPVDAEVAPPSSLHPTDRRPGVDAEPGPAISLANTSPAEIPIADITPNPHQPRRQMNEAGIAELAASIRSTGLIQPVIVRRTEQGYQLIAGERRLRAARQAGLATIPAILRDVDSFTQAQMALVENIQREDLNPVDRAQSYRALMDQLGLTQVELSARLGEDRSSIANFLRLLDLSEPARQLVRDGKLTLGHAKILAGVSDILEQQRLADLVVAQDLSVRNLERLVATEPPERPVARRTTGAAHLVDLEKSISRQLGMRVQVRAGGKGRGRLVIHYASLDQFDELLAKLDVKTD